MTPVESIRKILKHCSKDSDPAWKASQEYLNVTISEKSQIKFPKEDLKPTISRYRVRIGHFFHHRRLEVSSSKFNKQKCSSQASVDRVRSGKYISRTKESTSSQATPRRLVQTRSRCMVFTCATVSFLVEYVYYCEGWTFPLMSSYIKAMALFWHRFGWYPRLMETCSWKCD